jgi:hypothetical protein
MFVYFYYLRELHGLGSDGVKVLCTRARARFRLGLYVVLPKSSAGSINFIWTTYLGNYHNCSTLLSVRSLLISSQSSGPMPSSSTLKKVSEIQKISLVAQKDQNL